MKDWLPILIGVIWVAFTLYNKGQKGKQKQQKPASSSGSTTKSPSILEQILTGQVAQVQQIYDEPEEEYADPIPESIDFSLDDSAIEKKETEVFLNNELSQFKTEGQHAIFENAKEDQEKWMQANIEFDNNDFDLKKAVIYSAILEAPYID